MRIFKPVLSVLAFCLLSACSHVVAPGRSPSSIQTMGMSATLDEILASPDPQAEARAYVDRLLVIELRAHGWMFETDEIFANATKPVNLFREQSYLKLLVAHPLVERMQAKIVEFYREAYLRTMGEVVSAEGRARVERSMLVVSGVHDSLLHAHHNVAERVLLNDLMRALKEARRSANPAQISQTLVVPLEGDDLFAAAADSREQIQQMLLALPATDDVKQLVEDRAAELSSLLHEEAGREPQSLNIFPTAAANGNIDGFSFPRSTWAITFDDGPDPEISEQDVANLTAAGTKATFFWLAKNVAVHPDIVKKVQAAGMPLENHSWTHPQLDNPKDLARLNTNLDKEINQSTAEDIKVYGVKPRFFRCPYGAGFENPVIRGMIAKLGMVHVLWNVDSLDWKDPNPITVQARVEQQMLVNGRGIILFHDIHTPALMVVPRLLARYKGRIRLVTIPQIVDELNGVAAQKTPAPPPHL